MADQGLFPAAGALLQGAAQTEGANQDRAQKERAMQAEQIAGMTKNVTDIATTKFSEDQAMERQKLAGQQQIQTAIETSKLNAEQERQKYLQDTVEVPQEFADGLAKTTGVEGFKKLGGQRAPWKEMNIGSLMAARAKYLQPQKMEWTDDAGKTHTGMAVLKEDANGNITVTGQSIGGAVPKPDRVGNSIDEKKTKAAKLLDQIRKAEASGDDDTVQSTIAAYNDIASDLQMPSYSKAPGFWDSVKGLFGKSGGNGGGDSAITDFLKKGDGKRPYADNPANRKWAQEQLSGK